MRFSVLLSSSITSILFACTEANLNELKDPYDAGDVNIEVSPPALDFGLLSYDDPAVLRTFTISSVGADPATISAIEISGVEESSFSLVSPFVETVLQPGESMDVQVAFQAHNPNQLEAEAIVFSDDSENSEEFVYLFGMGAVPDLLITPNPLNFGTTYVGCDANNQVTLRNVGSEELVIYNVGMQADPFFFTNSLSFPLTLQPEEEIVLDMSFAPPLEGRYTNSLEVFSTDPDGPQTADIAGNGLYVASYEQYWSNPVDPPSDIIFSVDQSGSMYDDAALLASSFSTFINQLNNYSTNWQIMVVNDDNGCNNSGILTANTPSYQSIFSSAVQSGGGGYTESLLTVTRNAIENTDPGECNYGFLRPNAMLHIIMVSDEPEQSGGSHVDFLNQIIAKKGNASNVRMSVIYNPNDNWGRYTYVANATGGLSFSIYDGSWSSASNLQLLAAASIIADKYDLDNPAVESTIHVEINGYTVSNNWHYDAAQQAVFFDSNPPGEGDTIRITYASPATCE